MALVSKKDFQGKKSLLECKKEKINLSVPEFRFCTDNAAMIAASGYYAYIRGDRADLTLNANSGLDLSKNS